MAADPVSALLVALILGVGGTMGSFIYKNYRTATTNDTQLDDIETRVEAVEAQTETATRLTTAAAYTLDQVVQRLNTTDDLDVDLDDVHFRDDFLRGGTNNDGVSPDGGQLAPHPNESLEDYHRRLFPSTYTTDDPN